MFFRRLIAGFLVLAFISISQISFLVFAFSNTFLTPDFYKDKISSDIYTFMVNITVDNLMDESVLLREYFTEADLRREIIDVFPQDIFDSMINQLILDMELLKDDPSVPLTLKLSVYRESLLTLAHNFSYNLFESIEKCEIDEVPFENDNLIPSCIPSGTEYNIIALPFVSEFEKTIYSAVPEQIQVDLNSTVLGSDSFVLSNVFQFIEDFKLFVYVTLIVVLVLIAFLVWKPLNTLLTYIGISFLVSGVSGVFLSYLIVYFPKIIIEKFEDMVFEFSTLFEKILSFFAVEMQKGAYLFLFLGLVIIIFRFFMKKN